jgi:hypothetical protein
MKNKIDLATEVLDLAIPSDRDKAIAVLVSANYPASPDECLRVFAAVADMLAFSLRKTLAQNWRNICHVAGDQQQTGGAAVVPVGVSFTIDQSAPAVAAVSKFKLHFGSRFNASARPQAFDVNNGELDLGETEDTAGDDPSIPPEGIELKAISEKLTKKSGTPVTVTLLPGKKRGRPRKPKVDKTPAPAPS